MRRNKIKLAFITLTIITIIIFTSKTYINANEEEVFVKNGPRDKKTIALTFDDGPHPKETNQVLDVLKKYDVKATFFIAGKHANWYSKPLIRASEEGHEIGNHTFNHPDISNLSKSQLEEEIIKCEEILVRLTGKKPTLFRPPYGSYKKDVLEEIAKKYNYKIVLWTTVDARDWQNPGASKIADTIMNNAKNGDIILLHDYATDDTVEALEILIPKMIEKGYKFVTVSELIDIK
ncbi:MAG: polysaccharide deacetylase family protein [Romboutsia sp.]|uniref:polysaccharide deacetylase family protein n=1 Tax=Romboutsia sp. TaxID=1965302 RepID=UPI003F2B6A44